MSAHQHYFLYDRVAAFYEAFLIHLDVEGALAILSRDVCAVSSGRDGVNHNFDEVAASLTQSIDLLAKDDAHYDFIIRDYCEIQNTAEVWTCLFQLITVKVVGPATFHFTRRATFTFKAEESTYRACAIHVSAPTLLLLEGEVYPQKYTQDLLSDTQLKTTSPIDLFHSLSDDIRKDPLTQVLNRKEATRLINQSLRRETQKLVLLIVDVDNFKTVNDQIGHYYGDIVLAQLAQELKNTFQATDVVGRIGGDEFFVFLEDYSSLEDVYKSAQRICTLFDRTYVENGASVSISASIGIAISPEHGATFEDLYRAADTALYAAKGKGKGSYVVYHPQLENSGISASTGCVSMDYWLKGFPDGKTKFIFKLLYGAKDFMAKAQIALGMIAQHFDFSRGYLMEFSPDGQYLSNTLEWCAQGIQSQIQNFQHIPITHFETTVKLLRQTGLFIITNVDELPSGAERQAYAAQDIRSLILFGVKDHGTINALVGFDDCLKKRTFTPEEIDDLSTLSHLIGALLFYNQRNGADQIEA
ncbi:diguanylate cyclase domain-containing protein [Eubacterium sp.]|uniref:diguanylate cyclase domain-containing protein n=1 Tax=Eubacterium sp. TaxID=142586 RepID=UPI002FCA964D